MMNCTITSLKTTKNYKNIQSIILPASSGQMQILPNHAESFILLKQGNLALQPSSKQEEIIQIQSGLCYIKNNAVVVIL